MLQNTSGDVLKEVNNMNSNDSVYVEKGGPQAGSFTSIKSARLAREETLTNFTRGQQDRNWSNALNEEIEKMKQISSESVSYNKLLSEALVLQKRINDSTDVTKKNWGEYLELLKESAEVTNKLNNAYYAHEIKIAKTEEEREKAAIKRNRDQAIYNSLLEDANVLIKENEEANKSALDAFSNSLDKIKGELKDLAVVKGVGDITSGLFDKSSTSSMLSAWSTSRSQLGLTGSQFNDFKRSLTTQLAKSDNFFNFGWKDTAEYISKLGELGITSKEMAEQQYLAVIQGTRYLGLTTETQAKILKLSRDTKNSDLLLSTNETMVQIMNAQLGISKEQLDQITN